ncbi:class I SAM-dependent methyltransferase [Planctomonas deserti]|uniref:class I SAM-dependent methyltransferase n=1 Tax=Planctomonas deserti TaxID=2144185 RepID=UPI000D3992E5|nr:class I SAM-dependent methyltransferase [Planctomonas deserti]
MLASHSDPATTISELTTSSIVAAALASALRDGRAGSPAEALRVDPARAAVLETLPGGAEGVLDALWRERQPRGNNLVSLLNQAAAAGAGATETWSDLSDDVLVAQGRSSVLMARVLLSRIGPAYGFLEPGSRARVLDVGTGIGAIASALAESLPRVEVTGIDIADRPLEIARERLTAAPGEVSARIHYRRQDVTELDELKRYDVVWMPLPFLPDGIVDQAVTRVTAALRPAGLLVLGTQPDVEDRRAAAAGAWLASLTGGGTLTASEVVRRLSRRGFEDVRRFETVPGGPILVGALAPS